MQPKQQRGYNCKVMAKEKYIAYVKIGKSKFGLRENGFNVRTLLDARDCYLKNKRERIYFVKDDMQHKMTLEELNELIEETDAKLSARDFFK